MNKISYKQINISGYKRLLHPERIELRPLTVMIGANGTGKTSFIEIFSLLAASAKGNLKKSMTKMGGFQSLLTCKHSDKMHFDLSIDIPGQSSLEYIIQLGMQGISYTIEDEVFAQKHDQQNDPFTYIHSNGSDIRYMNSEQEKLLQPNWDYNYSETALSQTPKMYTISEKFREHLSSCIYYSAHELNVSYNAPIRLPQTIQPATHPGTNGEDLITFLYYLRETDRHRFEVIEDTLRVAFPGFNHFHFPPVAAGTISMTWEDEFFSKHLYMNQLSEGTLRFICLISLLHSPELSTVTLIDEPEVSLHPELLNILSDSMREASKHTQLIVATHSDRLIGFLDPSEVLVFDSEEGMTQMTWADSPAFDLEIWLKDFTLGELWRMGHIGGRP
jgi:predicted ATPase